MTAQLDARPAARPPAGRRSAGATRSAGDIGGAGRTGRTGRAAATVATSLAAAAVVLFLLAAAAPGLLTPYSPTAPDPSAVLQAPSAAHLLGTDYLGRDIAARLVFGARETLIGAGVAVAVGLVGGVLLGAIAAVAGRFGDTAVLRLIDVLLSIPTLLIAIVLVAVLGFGTVFAGLAVGIASIGQFARLTRAQLLAVRSAPFVEAARVSGRGALGSLATHVFPNARGPILALVPVQFGVAVLTIAALGFLGFGAQPPTPEWGAMIADGSTYIISGKWWTVAFPSLVVVALVLSLNTLSRRLQPVREGGL